MRKNKYQHINKKKNSIQNIHFEFDTRVNKFLQIGYFILKA